MRYHGTYGTHNSRNLSQNVTTLHPLASASSLSISASTSAPVSLEDFQYFKLFDKRSCSPCVNMISQFEIFKLICRSVLSSVLGIGVHKCKYADTPIRRIPISGLDAPIRRITFRCVSAPIRRYAELDIGAF